MDCHRCPQLPHFSGSPRSPSGQYWGPFSEPQRGLSTGVSSNNGFLHDPWSTLFRHHTQPRRYSFKTLETAIPKCPNAQLRNCEILCTANTPRSIPLSGFCIHLSYNISFCSLQGMSSHAIEKCARIERCPAAPRKNGKSCFVGGRMNVST